MQIKNKNYVYILFINNFIIILPNYKCEELFKNTFKYFILFINYLKTYWRKLGTHVLFNLRI